MHDAAFLGCVVLRSTLADLFFSIRSAAAATPGRCAAGLRACGYLKPLPERSGEVIDADAPALLEQSPIRHDSKGSFVLYNIRR